MNSAERGSPRCSLIEPPSVTPTPGVRAWLGRSPTPYPRGRRPRAEDCDRLTAAGLRPLLKPGATHYRLADGTVLQLLWNRVRGGFGKGGKALGVLCPSCSASVLVLWRPPAAGWGCWRCHRISYPSGRRSGNKRGHRKPSTWQLEKITTEQLKVVALLGFTQWPPPQLLWCRADLEELPRAWKHRQLSARRRAALMDRLDALESLRLAGLLPTVRREIERLGGEEAQPLPPLGWLERAEKTMTETSWAVRRQAHDPRTLRAMESRRPQPFDPACHRSNRRYVPYGDQPTRMTTETLAARLDLRLAPCELAWFREVAKARKESLSVTVRFAMEQEAKRLGIPARVLERSR